MRKYYLTLIIFLSLTSQILPQGWIFQNPAPPGNTLHSVKFINVNTGWAVGDAGQIMITTDGGENWNNPISGNGGFLHSVYFIDSNNGGACW